MDPLDILDMKLPDLSGHPPPPHLSFEEYERWIFEDIVPMMAARGEMTEEKLMENFMKSEGSVKEWPDFGNLL
jgi:hypothetical protein